MHGATIKMICTIFTISSRRFLWELYQYSLMKPKSLTKWITNIRSIWERCLTTSSIHCNIQIEIEIYGREPWTIKASDARRITAAEMKYMRRTAGYTWARLQNKCTNCKGVKNNTNFGQITVIQEKLDTTCKQNAQKQITQGNEILLPNWQKESWQTFEETSGYVRPERVNK